MNIIGFRPLIWIPLTNSQPLFNGFPAESCCGSCSKNTKDVDTMRSHRCSERQAEFGGMLKAAILNHASDDDPHFELKPPTSIA